MDRTRCHVVVSGRVQNVWYRDSCRSEALAHKVDGWVRNRPDGTVEAVFEGSPAAVEEMISWCRRGPSRAVVEDIEVTREQPTGEAGFVIR